MNFPSARNLNVTEELDIVYESEQRVSSKGIAYYVITRRASKSYAFVDLTEDAARVAEEIRVAMYTRHYDDVVERDGHPVTVRIPNLTSEIFIDRDSPISCRLCINVRETDRRHSMIPVGDLKAFFSDLESRDYEENIGMELIDLVDVTKSYTTGSDVWDVSILVQNRMTTPATITFQYKDSASSTDWKNFYTQEYAAGERIGYRLNVPLVAFNFVRAVFGFVESQTVKVRRLY